jgi:hypothetical protein
MKPRSGLVIGCLQFLYALSLSAHAAAQAIPADGLHCDLQAPPEAAAKGVRPPHQQPMRMFPVNPGPRYTGCQWIWISFGFPAAWNYSAVTYYEGGAPKLHRVRYPPLPVQETVQECVFDKDGTARKVRDGSWQQDCPSTRQLQELLRITPKENDSWTFF